MQPQSDIIHCYNKTAEAYAAKFINELAGKHLDRILLKAFAVENGDKGNFIDLGCGPGQTTKFLYDCGIINITGVDLSPEMIAVAKSLNPNIAFDVADILNLKYTDDSFGAVIAFYAIIHFDYDGLKKAFEEIHRVLTTGGDYLLSFHIGNHTIHLDSFLKQDVNIDFHFFETATVIVLLEETSFQIIDVIEREPYKNIEHPSKRAYIWVRKSV